MTREHARELLAESPGASGRTFTLPELERLARALGIDPLTSSLEDWIAALDSLRSLELGSGSAADDVPDPYGPFYFYCFAFNKSFSDGLYGFVINSG